MDATYFENRDCEFYPCHEGEHINCLFCFCPLYHRMDCGGNFKLVADLAGGEQKDCSDCMLPHTKEGYAYVLSKLKQNP